MRTTDAIIIGGGQAGLAMGRCLADLDIDHVILERGRIGQRWRSERWDSLRLLTPNWQSRLPGWRYRGPDPHGYMTMPEVIDYLQGYAGSLPSPIEEHTVVREVRPVADRYLISTDRGDWRTRNVVIATGHSDVPSVPVFAEELSGDITQSVPSRYRRPDDLPDGGVLVVGAAASGVQLADEIQRSGRPVTLAVGKHTRLPRTYRGRDIMWWLDVMGVMDERLHEAFDAGRARTQPSLQLVGRPERSSIDLGTLQQAGVRLVGRMVGTHGTRIDLADDLPYSTTQAAIKLGRLIRRIDAFVANHPDGLAVGPPDPVTPILTVPSPTRLDLRAEGIRTVVWTTGYRRHYPWLRVPVLDERGEIRHEEGVLPVPGLYVLGLQFLRRRKSSFIDGVGDDARALSFHMAKRLRRSIAVAA